MEIFLFLESSKEGWVTHTRGVFFFLVCKWMTCCTVHQLLENASILVNVASISKWFERATTLSCLVNKWEGKSLEPHASGLQIHEWAARMF